MRVTVLLFAGLRDLVGGASEMTMTLPAGATIRDAWRLMLQRHPALAPYETVVSCARNADYSRMDVTLAEGDEVAFLPPVSGGAPHL
jgi:molybdopterin converting factor subunit 1